MGSEQRDRNGLSGTADGAKGYPEQFIIVDLDISAADLKARYVGTKRHAYVCEIIDGAVQRQRTKGPPSATFTRMLRRAKQIPPLSVCDLGRDGTKDGTEIVGGRKVKAGRNHVIIIDGRQRDMSTRANNVADIDDGKPARMLECRYVTFPATETRAAVVLFKVGSNVREMRTFSSRAEDAVDMRRGGYSDEDIAPYVEVTSAAAVELLCLLDGCDQSTKDRVDAGDMALADVRATSQAPEAEQARRAARKTAGTKRSEKDAAAPPRAKTRPARVLESVEAEVRGGYEKGESADDGVRSAFADGIAFARGMDAPSRFARFVESAEATRKAARS